MIGFPPVFTSTEIKRVAGLANEIWHEYYPLIIGWEQVEYMLERFQSIAAIAGQIKEGYHYHLIQRNRKDIGYLSFAVKDSGLFLSKIYLLVQERGEGLGRAAFDFICDEALRMGLDKVWLTVNRHNHPAISAYERWGFQKAEKVIQDIGGGFVMDDYRMELLLNTQGSESKPGNNRA